MMKLLYITIVTIFLVLIGSCQAVTGSQTPSDEFDDFTTLWPSNAFLSVNDIMKRAHEMAGGEPWRRPETLAMDGYAVFYKDGATVKHERHRMWRVYDAKKLDAHRVDGKVRILSEREGKAIIDLSYDGETTYTSQGAQPKSESDKRWSSNFGFGVIRHALDEGYQLERLPDDLIDGRASFIIRVIDEVGGQTQFGIRQEDYAIVKVGFDTPRGWHERIYSNFYSNVGDVWVQPGRVRLYYDGVKANEVIWTSYEINASLPDCLFVLPMTTGCDVG